MRMPVRIVSIAASALAALVIVVPAHAGAQLASTTSDISGPRVGATSIEVTPYAGYMMFGDFIDGPLGTSLTSSASPVYGAQLGLTLMPGVVLVGNVAHASGDLKVGIPLLGGINAGTTSALIADGGLQLSIPTPRSALYSPFIQAGVGATKWDVNLGSTGLTAHSTNLTGNLGAGLDLHFGRSVALRMMAKDYIGKFDFKEATSLDLSGKTAHNWALTAGVKLGF